MNATAQLSRSLVPSKSLTNPQRDKPVCPGDRALAHELQSLLNDVPGELRPARDTRLPLLTGLRRHSLAGAATARQLVFVAARIHHWSDERRTAEYLLRHRGELADGRRTAVALLSAARCAAEMDVRRGRSRELPIEPESFNRHVSEPTRGRTGDASVAETVVDYLRKLLGPEIVGSVAWGRLHDAVTVAIELAAEVADHGATGIRSMRSDARPRARLSCRLIDEFGNRDVARSLARLIVGADGTPIESALLWWVAHSDVDSAEVPEHVRARWARDLMDADPALATSRTRRRRARTSEGSGLAGIPGNKMRSATNLSRFIPACRDISGVARG
jgi:hypothetical protein